MIPAFVRTAVATAALISSLAACTSLHVTSDVNADLIGSVHCRTFAWAGSFRGASPLRGTIANPVNEVRLRAAISAHFAASGVQEATADPDCLVGYGIGARDVVAGAYPYGYGYYGWGWGYPYGPYGPYGYYGYYGGPWVYSEGIITIDLFDAKSHQALWHASVNQNLIGSSNAEAERRIGEAVALLFTRYPYPPAHATPAPAPPTPAAPS
jgi:hypothetical protein